jgi:hypothetical protein
VKPVPVEGLLRFVGFIVSVNPLELLEHYQRNQINESSTTPARKEATFLAALLPSIHSSAFELLSSIATR